MSSATIDNFPVSYTFICDKCGGRFLKTELSKCNVRNECMVCNYKTAYKNWLSFCISKEEYEQGIQKRIDMFRDYDRVLKEKNYFKEEFLERL